MIKPLIRNDIFMLYDILNINIKYQIKNGH